MVPNMLSVVGKCVTLSLSILIACTLRKPKLSYQLLHDAMQMPGPDIVRSIYYQMIQGHLSQFEPDVARMAGKLTDATIEIHKTVMNNFLPSSVKFHYQFNLREMSNITQVLYILHFSVKVQCLSDDTLYISMKYHLDSCIRSSFSCCPIWYSSSADAFSFVAFAFLCHYGFLLCICSFSCPEEYIIMY